MASDVLVTINDCMQTTDEDTALTFAVNTLVFGKNISHTANSRDIKINEDGIYQISFHGIAGIRRGTSVPSKVKVQLYYDNKAVRGAVTSHNFNCAGETESLGFDIAVGLEGGGNLRFVINDDGYTFTDIIVTVIRLGNIF